MPLHDPAPDAEPYYECQECGERTTGRVDSHLCPDCGGPLQNLSVPRQE